MWANRQYDWAMRRDSLPPATRLVLVGTVGLYLLGLLLEPVTRGAYGYFLSLSRAGLAHGYLWQLITYLFLHGSFWHLFMNMLVVYMFGGELERLVGGRRFLALYVGSGVLAGLGWVLISGGHGYCIGASGGVFGLIGMYAALFPNRPITLLLFFVLPLTMAARTMAILLGTFTFFSMFAHGSSVAHAAHLAGGLAGYWYGRHLLAGARRGDDRRVRDFFAGASGWASRAWRHPDQAEAERPAPTAGEVDAILDKILAHGVGSLTPRERLLLEAASRELARR